MSRGITNKGVDKFVEMSFDNRFNSLLFASSILTESDDVNRKFFDVILDYLQLMSNKYERGVGYAGLQDVASSSYVMYQEYLRKEGTGSNDYPDLNTFDT